MTSHVSPENESTGSRPKTPDHPVAQTSMNQAAHKLLAIFVALGGLVGIWLLIGVLFRDPSTPIIAIALFYLANIITGWWLWTNPRLGLAATIMLQVFQVISVDGPTFTYQLANSAGLWLKQTTGSPEFTLLLGSSFHFARTTGFGDLPTGPAHFGINFVPIAVAALAFALQKSGQIASPAPTISIASIGTRK
jgi:hypothetical protein